MERNAQLDVVGVACRRFAISNCRTEALLQRTSRSKSARIVIAATLLLSSFTHSQCTGNATVSPVETDIQQRFNDKNWPEVVRLAAPLSRRSADVDFVYGMALAHLQRWHDARAALLAGHRECPQQERFAVELAGVAFELKHNAEAAEWLRDALRVNSGDEYANSFAGTVYLLMGNVNAALKFWNRVQKPYVAVTRFDSQLRAQRLILDRAFAFSPAAVLNLRDYETTQAQLGALGIFSSYNIVLNARSDEKFDVDFHAVERDGFGSSRLQALVSILSGIPYETVYPAYYNVGGTAANIESLLRWDSQKRRAWVSASAPLHNLPRWRGTLQLDVRDENWAIRNSFTGLAPVLGSFDLEWQSASAFITGIPSGRVQWTAGVQGAHRSFHGVVPGIALTSALLAQGFSLKVLGSIQSKIIDVPERRFKVLSTGRSELARMWPTGEVAAPHLFGKLQAGAIANWFPQAEGDLYEAQQRLRVGHIFQNAPIDELYLLGMERDTDLWLRGHVGTRNGRKGSSPLADNYFLANSDFYRRIYSNGLITIKAGPLLDVARASAPTPNLASSGWYFDAGAQAKFTVLGTSIVFTWGHDLRSGSNAFYGTAAAGGVQTNFGPATFSSHF
jgi:tetratricopeptide (TPR) repeat protein